MKENLEPFYGQRYECKMCGECCHCRIVPLSTGDIGRIQRFGHDNGFFEYNTKYRSAVLARREWDSGCSFLDDGRCTIHSFKPLVCRLFPYAIYFAPPDGQTIGKRLLADGTEVYIYIDTSCPGVGRERTCDDPKWLLELAQRIRLEMALTRYYHGDIDCE